MGLIPSGKSWEEIDREAIAEALAQRKSEMDGPLLTSDRVHRFLLELERRFTQAGQADPVIVQEVIADLRREVGG